MDVDEILRNEQAPRAPWGAMETVFLAPEEREALERMLRSRTAAVACVRRARIILLLAQGRSISEIARTIGIERRIVRKWGRRFHELRLNGLREKRRNRETARQNA